MKRFFSIFFLVIFLFNTMGYFIVFQLEQLAAKQEMRENISLGLSDDRISVLTINNNQLSDLLPGTEEEFTYEGKKYDLLKKENDGAQTRLYAVSDTREDHLFSFLNDQFHSNTDLSKAHKHPSATKDLSKLVKTDYFPGSPEMTVPARFSTPLFCTAESFYHSINRKTSLQPPRTA
jgi:hypothetical protein